MHSLLSLIHFKHKFKPIGLNKSFYSISQSGICYFPLIAKKRLLTQNSELLAQIRACCDLDKGCYQRYLEPLLERFIVQVGCLPASQGTHDAQAGGLFSHSLNVLYYALLLIAQRPSHYYDRRDLIPYELAVWYAALAHDLGKIYHDYKVYGEDGYHWQPFEQDFYRFAKSHCCKGFYVDFISGRQLSHQHCFATNALLLHDFCSQLVRLLPKNVDVYELINGQGAIWALINEADMRVIKALSVSEQHSPDLLGLMSFDLFKQIQSYQISFNQLDSEIFVTKVGLLVRRYSRLAQQLKARYSDIVSDDENSDFLSGLRTQGLVHLDGRKTVFSWMRLEVAGQLLYVQGLLLKIANLTENYYCPCVPRGPVPYEIQVLLTKLEAEQNHPVVQFALKDPFVTLGSGGLRLEDLDAASVIYGPNQKELDQQKYQTRFDEESQEIEKSLLLTQQGFSTLDDESENDWSDQEQIESASNEDLTTQPEFTQVTLGKRQFASVEFDEKILERFKTELSPAACAEQDLAKSTESADTLLPVKRRRGRPRKQAAL